MPEDIVIDTNVFLHAENEQEQRQQECQNLITILYERATKLCVDEGFGLDSATNRSVIGHEYIKHLRAGSLGYALVDYLARSERVSILSRKVPQSVSKHIRQIPDSPDRTFVRIAYNSADKLMVSHDFDDIPETVRARLRKAIAVTIIDASGAAGTMQINIDPIDD